MAESFSSFANPFLEYRDTLSGGANYFDINDVDNVDDYYDNAFEKAFSDTGYLADIDIIGGEGGVGGGQVDYSRTRILSDQEYRGFVGDAPAYLETQRDVTPEAIKSAFASIKNLNNPQELQAALSNYYGYDVQAKSQQLGSFGGNLATHTSSSKADLQQFHSLVEPILREQIPYIQATKGLSYQEALADAYATDPMLQSLYFKYDVKPFRQTKDGSTYLYDPFSFGEIRTLEVEDPSAVDIGISIFKSAALAAALGPLGTMIGTSVAGAGAAGAIASSMATSAMTAQILGGDPALAALMAGFTTGVSEAITGGFSSGGVETSVGSPSGTLATTTAEQTANNAATTGNVVANVAESVASSGNTLISEVLVTAPRLSGMSVEALTSSVIGAIGAEAFNSLSFDDLYDYVSENGTEAQAKLLEDADTARYDALDRSVERIMKDQGISRKAATSFMNRLIKDDLLEGHLIGNADQAGLDAFGFDGVRNNFVETLNPSYVPKEWSEEYGGIVGQTLEGREYTVVNDFLRRNVSTDPRFSDLDFQPIPEVISEVTPVSPTVEPVVTQPTTGQQLGGGGGGSSSAADSAAAVSAPTVDATITPDVAAPAASGGAASSSAAAAAAAAAANSAATVSPTDPEFSDITVDSTLEEFTPDEESQIAVANEALAATTAAIRSDFKSDKEFYEQKLKNAWIASRGMGSARTKYWKSKLNEISSLEQAALNKAQIEHDQAIAERESARKTEQQAARQRAAADAQARAEAQAQADAQAAADAQASESTATTTADETATDSSGTATNGTSTEGTATDGTSTGTGTGVGTGTGTGSGSGSGSGSGTGSGSGSGGGTGMFGGRGITDLVFSDYVKRYEAPELQKRVLPLQGYQAPQQQGMLTGSDRAVNVADQIRNVGSFGALSQDQVRGNLMQGYNDELFTEAVMQNLYRNNQ